MYLYSVIPIVIVLFTFLYAYIIHIRFQEDYVNNLDRLEKLSQKISIEVNNLECIKLLLQNKNDSCVVTFDDKRYKLEIHNKEYIKILSIEE